MSGVVGVLQAVRSALGIVAGFGIFWGALQAVPFLIEQGGADSDPMMFVLVHVSIATVAAFIAGLATAWIAGTHEFPHVSTVGLLMIGMAVLSMKSQAVFRPGWYQIAIAGCGPISAMTGGAIVALLRVRRRQRANER